MPQKPPGQTLVWAKFIVGAILFCFMLYVHVYVKELSLWIIGIPAVLMGIDPTKFIGPKK